MAERHALRVAAVFAADAELDVRPRLADPSSTAIFIRLPDAGSDRSSANGFFGHDFQFGVMTEK